MAILLIVVSFHFVIGVFFAGVYTGQNRNADIKELLVNGGLFALFWLPIAVMAYTWLYIHNLPKIKPNKRKKNKPMSEKKYNNVIYIDGYHAYIRKSIYDKEVAELKAEIERLRGRSNRKLSDRFTEILNKFTEEDIQRWIDADAKRLNETSEYVCPNQCDWIGMFGGELCDECKKREQ